MCVQHYLACLHAGRDHRHQQQQAGQLPDRGLHPEAHSAMAQDLDGLPRLAESAMLVIKTLQSRTDSPRLSLDSHPADASSMPTKQVHDHRPENGYPWEVRGNP